MSCLHKKSITLERMKSFPENKLTIIILI
ncbi:hypothetical protein AERO8C_70032 [Aeromonas veronii]|uniref:Uncharacterized protein n=1 Tax=Aeromonas veronii TaxID=654 RepID=A0A653LAM9_AERVE|nr:hypothetical protein AERO8C_70032 [Aeromonas veronii]